MIRYSLFLWLAAISLVHAEVLTRAYFIGKHPSYHWQNLEGRVLNPVKNSDPFDAKNEPSISVPEVKKLEKAPFESPHLGEGDVLYDFKVYQVQAGSENREKPQHAIYNESTGWIVVVGEPDTHWRYRVLCETARQNQPRMIEMTFRFEEAENLLMENSLLTLPGATGIVLSGEGENQLQIDCEAQIDANDAIIEVRHEIKGTIRNQVFALKTGSTLFQGIPEVVAYGKNQTSEPEVTLTVTGNVILAGGIRMNEMIRDGQGEPLKKEALKLPDSEIYRSGSLNKKTGKIFKAFRLPPTFLTMIGPTPVLISPEDPFEAEPSPSPRSRYPHLSKWDPRIPTQATGRMINLRKFLASNGITFNDSDFAVFNVESFRLFVEMDPINLDPLEEIIRASQPSPPRMIGTELELIETATRPIDAASAKTSGKVIQKVGTAVLPGQSVSLQLGDLHYSVESQIDANDSIIEIRGALETKKKDQLLKQWKSSLTVTVDEPMIVQTYSHEGKWRSLILTAKIREINGSVAE